MKVTRVICPRCKAEDKHIENINNVNDYREELVYKKCDTCKDVVTPEERLLAAISGEEIE